MYRNYYSMNDMPQKIENHNNLHKSTEKPIHSGKNGDITDIFKNLQSDDVVLLAVLLILFMDDCDDKLLLLVLGALLFLG